MRITRRNALKGAAAASAVAGLGAFTACSSSPKKDTSSAASKDVAVWIWPSGFSAELLAYVGGKFPDYAIKQNVIGGDFKQKLSTTFAAKTGLPDITGVKGEDIAFFLEKADFFEDLNSLGFDKVKGQYLDWKVKQGQTVDGRQIGFPIDIGPTVTFYRFDIFEKAGLPTDPKKLEPSMKTWEDYFKLGQELIKALPGHFLIRNAASVYDMSMLQQDHLYITKEGVFDGGGAHIRTSWERAVAALKAGIVARIDSNTPDVQAMVNTGKLPADFGAAWHLDDLQGDAPETAGKWHITDCPGGAANNGGSFLTIPKGSPDKERAFKIISVMMDAKGQETEYEKKGYFPSMPEVYKSAALTGENKFLGNQKAIDYFGKAAEAVHAQFKHAQDDAVGAPFFKEIGLVEASNKDPKQAFDDALAASKKLAEQLGVKLS